MMNLKSLHFETQPFTTVDDPLHGLCAELEHTPSFDQIREMNIVVGAMVIEAECSADRSHWEPLDVLLANKTRFPSLEYVAIRVISWKFSSEEWWLDPLRVVEKIYFTNLRLRLGVAFSFVIVDRIRLSEL